VKNIQRENAEFECVRRGGGEWRALMWTGAALLMALGWSGAEAGPQKERSATGDRVEVSQEGAGAGVEAGEKSIRLNYLNVGWNKVLKDLSEETGMPLVADRVPSSKYNRRDKQKYDLNEAMKILNQELERKGFRLIKKGNYLVLVDLPSTRTEYSRPTVGTNHVESPTHEQEEVRDPQIQQAGGEGRNARIRKVTHQNALADEEVAETNAHPIEGSEASSGMVVREVQLSRSGAVPLARSLFQVFKTRAELVDEGPEGLQAFRVFELDSHGLRTQEVSFTLGIDDRNQVLVVEAVPEVAKKVSELIELLDRGVQGKKVQPVLTKENPQEVAQKLQPQLEQIAAASGENESLEVAEAEESEKPEVPLNQPGRRGGKEPESTGMEGLKGDVSIESMSDLGVLILKGSQRDVDSVMKIIREIEKMSLGATPNVELVMLQHVNSESLSRLLNNVYEKLHATKIRSGPNAANTTPRISSIPVVKPNSILVLAPADEIPNVLKLVEELDQPVPPETEYQVFRLEHTTPRRVEEMIDKLYSSANEGNEPVGLATRVRVYGDIRTNSVVVQARPRDLVEVESLIKKLDVAESGPVSQLKIIPLKYANADELSQTLRQAIQSVVSPSGNSGGQNSGFPQGNNQQDGGSSGGTSDLNEVKSTILQFLSIDQGRPLRSGILSDIRINSDPRTNSLVVSAPEQSLALIEAVILNLDRPASAVAEIKVFELARGDATAMAGLLSQIFNTTTGGGTGNNQQTQTGTRPITIAGSESAGTQIPLKVSVDVRTNSIIATGSAEALKVAEAILLRLDQSDIRQRETIVIRLKNSKAEDVAQAVNEFLTSRRDVAQADTTVVSPFEQIEREVVIVPELGSNSLIISATPRFFPEIKQTVEKLDEAPKQVIIQALLVEVGLDNTDEFGMELGLQDSILFRRSALASLSDIVTLNNTTTNLGTQTTTQTIVSQSATPGYNFNNGGPLGNNTNPLLNTGAVGSQGLSNFQLGRVNSDLGYGGFVFSASSESVSVLLRALAANRRVDILSRPQIRALDNQQAQIFVGQDVPRINGFNPASTTVPGSSATPNVEQKETGIGLTVTPRITPERTVFMQIAAEKSALSSQGVDLITNPNGSVIRSPVIDKSVANTTVSVRDGQTIVLGGMITKNDENFERKVPYFGDLPVVGTLFRYDFSRSRRTELLIFLTPRIISSDEDSELIKQIEMERISLIESEAEQVHGPLRAAPPPLVDDFMNSNVEPLPPGTYDEDPAIPLTSPEGDDIPRLPSENSETAPPPALPPAEEPVQQMGGYAEEESVGQSQSEKRSLSGIRRVGFSPRRRTTATRK